MKAIGAIAIGIGLAIVIGTAGACDTGTITMGQMVARMGIGLAAALTGLLIGKRV